MNATNAMHSTAIPTTFLTVHASSARSFPSLSLHSLTINKTPTVTRAASISASKRDASTASKNIDLDAVKPADLILGLQHLQT